MRVLLALTYYRPHVSGLTIYVERLARALVERGHAATVLTSRYDAALPLEEQTDGVRVVRVPVAARISKGVIMPGLGRVARRLARQHDVLSLHLPQFDAAGLALRGRALGMATILTYHCDLQLPPGPFNALVNRVIYAANFCAAVFAHRIVTYTQDYADHSPLLSRFKDKVVIIPPPVVVSPVSREVVGAFRDTHVAGTGPIIGFAARLAAEKGVEYLVAAVPELLRRFPNLKVLFAGPYQNIRGEEAYWRRLQPAIDRIKGHWEFLGTLGPPEMSTFFSACDVLVVPSLNSTESFGLVQVEAMLCGTPVVASDLPGVRQPVRLTGMGEIVPPGDARALAVALGRVLEHSDAYARPRAEIESLFDLNRTVEQYETLFAGEMSRQGKPVAAGRR